MSTTSIINISAHKLIKMSALQLANVHRNPQLDRRRSALKRDVKEMGVDTDRVVAVTGSAIIGEGTRVFITFDEALSDGTLIVRRQDENSGLFVAALGVLLEQSNRRLSTVKTLIDKGYKPNVVDVPKGAELLLELSDRIYRVDVLNAGCILNWLEDKLIAVRSVTDAAVFDKRHHPDTLRTCYKLTLV